MRVASLLIALTLTAVAYADEPKQPEARTHYEAGAAAFTNQNFTEASQEFSAAYQIEPVPEVLWSWAQSERLAGHCVTAVGLYRKYAREAEKPSQAKAANDMIGKCNKGPKGPTKMTVQGDVVVEQPVAQSPWYTDKLGGALSATGVVGVTVGVTFFALASASHSAADNIVANNGFLDDYERKLDETTVRRRFGAAALGIGLVALSAGATIYIMHDRKQRALAAGTDGRVVFVGARF